MIFSRTKKDSNNFFSSLASRLRGALAVSMAGAAVATWLGATAFVTNASATSTAQSAGSKVAIVSTTRPSSQANSALIKTTLAAQTTAPSAPNLGSQVIYKLVDAQGRTTYANSPIAGGQKVDLPNLTVMDSQWPSALANATTGSTSTQVVAPAPVQISPQAAHTTAAAASAPFLPPKAGTSAGQTEAVKAPIPQPFSMVPVGAIQTINTPQPITSATATERAPVETVKLFMASNDSRSTIATAPTPPPTLEKLRADATLDPMQLAAAQRRAMLEAELRAQENFSRDVRQTLTKEEAESAKYRQKTQALAQAMKKNASTAPEQKAIKEALLAHFERKRVLQDELNGHERTAEALREVLRAR